MNITNTGPKARPNYMKQIMRPVSYALVLALLLTTVLTATAASVGIQKTGSKQDASSNYLVDNFDYLNKESRLQRMADVVEQTFTNPETLDDYYERAARQIATGKYTDAISSIDECIDLYNSGSAPQYDEKLYTDLLLKKGCLYVLQKDYTNALSYIRKALAIDPNNTDAYLIEAQIFAEQQDYDSLIVALDNYLRLVPDDTEIRGLLAQAKFMQENYQAANTEYGRILDETTDPKILYLYGLTAIQNEAYDQGEASLNAAIQIDDSYDCIYYYRGVCRMSGGKYEEAIEDMNTSLKRGELVDACHYTRAVCTLMLEDYNLDDVKADLRAAIDGEDETVAQQASELMSKLDEAIKAAEDMRNGITDDPFYDVMF